MAAPNISMPPPGTPAQEWASQTISQATESERPIAHGENSMPSVGTAQQATGTGSSGIVPATRTDAKYAEATTHAAPPAQPQTPGTDFPGSYPSSGLTPADEKANFSAVSNAWAPIQDSLGKAAQTAASYLPAGVADTINQYVPGAAPSTAQASANDATHTTSYPSKEIAGHLPGEHVGGVGALPGAITESAVSKLPDERIPGEAGSGTATTQAQTALETARQKLAETGIAASATAGAAAGTVVGVAQGAKDKVTGTVASATSTGTTTTAIAPATSLPTDEVAGQGEYERSSGAGKLPGTIAETGVAVLPQEKVLLPTSETEGAYPGEKTSGVGPLPGRVGEEGVAKAPGEYNTTLHSGAAKLDGVSLPTTETEGVRPSEKTAGVGALPGRVDEQGVAKLPDESAPTKKTEAVKQKVEKAAAVAPGKANGTAPLDTTSTTSAPSASSGEASPHKSGFMSKIKGEVKILSGKLGRNHDKVEEGKQLKAGTVQ
ncbi:hypothetical protein PUNSTDRAFT_46542 [Punctularia strigosozonata HHB-11173 SS5]|uniref:uncharacterized protein n=1 Tax=Punctularia strigosozonata (strain HHB-11173) TaxID=741275 RepID=UPI0004416CEF|nr:uncharacterized protein PUNSTDRAFT_46542 [Punctularia strigosozonata HHB-11173 SS5]EIN05654.1 hypothetical protein PUNSTDRAFT_46542 [Punctularia strigosozonata HHB-11173 SS5]